MAKKIHSFAAGFSEGFLPEFPDEVTAVSRLAHDLMTGRTSDCEGWLESVTDALYLDCKDSLYAYELLQEVRKSKKEREVINYVI